MEFPVERGEPFLHPERWIPARDVEAHSAQDAIVQVATETGWYRSRQPFGDVSWTVCKVSLHGETGETQIECPDHVPF